jgi:hypothetical protein
MIGIVAGHYLMQDISIVFALCLRAISTSVRVPESNKPPSGICVPWRNYALEVSLSSCSPGMLAKLQFLAHILKDYPVHMQSHFAGATGDVLVGSKPRRKPELG